MSGETHDWTRGPAKWLGAGALGGAAIVGLIWSLVARTPLDPAHADPPEDSKSSHAGSSSPVTLVREGSPPAGDAASAPRERDVSQEKPGRDAAGTNPPSEPAHSHVDPPPPPTREPATPVAPTAPPDTAPEPNSPAPTAPSPVSPTPPNPTPAPSSPPTPSTAPKPNDKPASIARKINVNTATQAELESLPDIGPALARRIIEFRTRKGPFRRVDELDNVSGIGPRTLERLRPLVTTE